MSKFLEWLQIRIAITNWSVLPAPVWVLIASPLLRWSIGGSTWFHWPCGCSKSPFAASFWCVKKGSLK